MHDEMNGLGDDAVHEAPHDDTHDDTHDALHDDMLRDDVLRDVVDRLRAPVAASAGFDEWIMTEIRAGEAERLQVNTGTRARIRSWFSRHAELLTAETLLVIAAVTIFVLRTTVHVPSTSSAHSVQAGGTPNVAAASSARMSGVRFAFSAPDAHSVTVAGTFNGWDTHATPLRRDVGGMWSVNIPLDAGRYAYVFVVDGRRWALDPSAARDAADDFGTPNSVVMVASAAREL